MAKLPGTEVTSFQRAPTWVVNTFTPASLLGKDDPAYNPEYTAEEKKLFRENPEEHNKYRRKLIHNINDGFKMVSAALCARYPSRLTFNSLSGIPNETSLF